MSNFKYGDKVQLKGGGSIMTVERMVDKDLVECTWFEDFDPMQVVFNADRLKVYKSKKKGKRKK